MNKKTFLKYIKGILTSKYLYILCLTFLLSISTVAFAAESFLPKEETNILNPIEFIQSLSNQKPKDPQDNIKNYLSCVKSKGEITGTLQENCKSKNGGIIKLNINEIKFLLNTDIWTGEIELAPKTLQDFTKQIVTQEEKSISLQPEGKVRYYHKEQKGNVLMEIDNKNLDTPIKFREIYNRVDKMLVSGSLIDNTEQKDMARTLYDCANKCYFGNLVQQYSVSYPGTDRAILSYALVNQSDEGKQISSKSDLKYLVRVDAKRGDYLIELTQTVKGDSLGLTDEQFKSCLEKNNFVLEKSTKCIDKFLLENADSRAQFKSTGEQMIKTFELM